MQHRDNYTFLTSAPIPRVIGTMALPTIISMLVTSLYNLADTFFVSQINTQCTAAVGIVFSIVSVVQAIGFCFGHGSGNYISRKLGARQTSDARCMAATGFVYSVSFGLLLAVAGHIWITDLALALGSTPTILPYTTDYLGIVLLGTPFVTGSLTLNNQMRFQGNAAYSMYGILTGALLNVALDPLLIFGLDMGIRGAAWATVVSQICSFFILLYMTRKNGGLRIRLRYYSPQPRLIKEIFLGGTPSLSRQGLAALSTMALNVAAGTFGDAAIAGMSIVSRCCFFVFAIIIGLGQGFQPLCGFCYGAKRYHRVKQGFWFCVKLGTMFLGICAIFGCIFAESIIRLFRHDPAVITTGAAALRWQMLTFVLLPTIGLTNMLLQTIRKPLRANLVAAARSGLFFIPLIYLLPRYLGLTGVEMCQAVSDLCSFAVCLPMVWSVFREMSGNDSGNKADEKAHST